MSEIKIIDTDEAPRDEHDGVVTHRLVGSDEGSEGMSFGISIMPKGFGGEATYPDQDEIVSIASGTVEITIDGKVHTLGEGKTLFIPKGKTYGLKVIEGPNKVFYAFSPAKS